MSTQSTTFKLRTPSHIESCHLIGSWDNYGKKMSMAQDTAAGPGFWKITLKFPSTGSPVRYWYYYILDGYFESHDPNQPTCKEPTRGITLNILDCGVSRESSPTSSTSSRRSSRFPSPSSSISSSGSPPPCAHRDHHGRRCRTPSPPPHRPASHIIQPIPRNPLTQHKLTLDTNCRPVSVMTSAATINGSRSSSASSGRSNFSQCSGSTVFSEDGSPVTPVCNCPFTEKHRNGVCWASDDESCCSEEDSCCSSDSEDEYEQRIAHAPKRAGYHSSSKAGGELAYELERRLRM